MIVNPFIEGAFLVCLGLCSYVLSAFVNVPQLIEVGNLLVPTGLGYIGGAQAHAISQTK